jgi:DNA-binding NarL/FixJ family response regulator
VQGTFVMGPKVRERCAPDAPAEQAPGTRGRPVTRLDALSPRELEVLRLIGQGLSCPQIAAELCRSIKTIESHQHRVMIKLGLGTRSEAMRFAIREGLAEV